MNLVSFTNIAFQINAVLDEAPNLELSFKEIHDAAEVGSLLEHLAERLKDHVDFSLTLTRPEEHKDVERALSDVAGSLYGCESKKAGVRQRGLCLVMAIILEAIQQQFISNSLPVRSPTKSRRKGRNPTKRA